ncbi:MAG: hypothetical protein ACI9WC_002599 [Arenicella sp.]
MKDNQKISLKSTSEAERKIFDLGNIWSNSIECLICSDVIRSKHQHDFVICLCGEARLDGGTFKPEVIGIKENIEFLIEYYDDAEQVSQNFNCR